jgi:hypothetical protein
LIEPFSRQNDSLGYRVGPVPALIIMATTDNASAMTKLTKTNTES